MQRLLDTPVLLWALLEPQKLSPEWHNALAAWEIATTWRLGKLQHRLAAVDLPISGAVARQAAQAKAHDLVLASTDPAFTQFEGVVTLALVRSPGLEESLWQP